MNIAGIRSVYWMCVLILVTVVLTATGDGVAGTETSGERHPSDNTTHEPHLFFKKTVVQKEYRKGTVQAEPYSVKDGEYLWKILRDHYRMSDVKIAYYCKITKSVNPEVQDINALYPGQKLFIPLRYVPESDTQYTVSSGEYLFSVMRNYFGLSDTVIFSRLAMQCLQEANPHIKDLNKLEPGQKVIIPREIFAMEGGFKEGAIAQSDMPSVKSPGDIPARRIMLTQKEMQIKDSITHVIRSFDGTDNQTGVHIFKSGNNMNLTVDFSRFPLYGFPWGKKVLFDYGDRLPPEAESIISDTWNDAEVVSVTDKDDLESILHRVLERSGMHRVEKEGEYLVNRDNIQIKVRGNWIAFQDSHLKKVFVVNLVKDNETAIHPDLQEYLAGLGMHMVDVYPDGRKEQSGEQTAVSLMTQETAADFSDAETIVLVDRILDTIGVAYQKDYSTKIFQNMYNGFSLEVLADRMFEHKGNASIIDFQSLPRRIVDIIVEQGVRVLQVDVYGEETETVITKVLDFCDVDYDPSPVELVYARGSKSNIKITIPGVLMKREKGNVLLTGQQLNDSIIRFLYEKGLKIIRY